MKFRGIAGGIASMVLLASATSGFASDHALHAARTPSVRAFSAPLGQETAAMLPGMKLAEQRDRPMSFADALMQTSEGMTGSRGLPAITSLLEGMGFAVREAAVFSPNHVLAARGSHSVETGADPVAAGDGNGRVCKSKEYVDANGEIQRRNTCAAVLPAGGAGLFSGASGIVAGGLGLAALAIMAASSANDAQTPVSSL